MGQVVAFGMVLLEVLSRDIWVCVSKDTLCRRLSGGTDKAEAGQELQAG